MCSVVQNAGCQLAARKMLLTSKVFYCKFVVMEREFDWIVLLPALLHFEMNSAKAFMELNWSVFMENIVIGLRFVSKKSPKYIRKGSDHHKLWQILEISYLSLTDELLLSYVRNCISQCTTATVKGYWGNCENI